MVRKRWEGRVRWIDEETGVKQVPDAQIIRKRKREEINKQTVTDMDI